MQIVVPSQILAERCRANAPDAQFHVCTFEEFNTSERFDLCLFSESFQYIRLDTGLSKALSLLNKSGEILIADCFRSATYRASRGGTTGGGHPIAAFRKMLADQPLTTHVEEEITASVAPSIDLEQGLFNVIGHTLAVVDRELNIKRPRSRWLLHRGLRIFLNERNGSASCAV